MALTDTAVRNAKPKEKPYKLADAQGLYLLINPKGSKLWRIKYRMNGVERKLALGGYPDITLAGARTARDAARKQMAEAVDPNAVKRQARIDASIRAANSFEVVAKELIEKKGREGRAAATLKKQRWPLQLLGQDFRKRPVADVTPQELLHELQP
jgi:Arm DNA-binding domain